MPSRRYWRLRFFAVMVGFVAAVLILYREPVIGPVFLPLQKATAAVTVAVLHIVGVEARQFDTILFHPAGFGYSISHGCTGFLPAAFLTVGVLAYPASGRCKAWGILVGVPLLLLLNLLRLVHLFVIGVWWPAWFDLAHELIWESAMVGSIFWVWFGWTVWSDRQQRPSRDQEHRPSNGTYDVSAGTDIRSPGSPVPAPLVGSHSAEVS